MNKTTLITFAIFSILVFSGCDDQEARTRGKKAKPTFMFWCYRNEIVSSTYHISDMTTPLAANFIQNKLKSIPGYVDSSYDLNARTLTVSYQSSTVRMMNFEEAIALAGFSVNNRPANPAAAEKIPNGVK